jgi:hypothetical protein
MPGPMSAEAQALHAVLADDLADAARILRDFLPGELRALQRACGLLGALCVDVRRDPFPAPGPVTPPPHDSHRPPPIDASGVARPGAAAAARTSRTSTPPSTKGEGGSDVVPPKPAVGGLRPAASN